MEIREALSVADHDTFVAKHIPDLGYEIREFQVFHWKLRGWRKLERSLTSSEFECGGYQWRILLFPFGNASIPPTEVVSVYLNCTGPKDPEEDWPARAQFALVMSNPHDPTIKIVSHADHRFTPEESDWGFTRFRDLKNLFEPQPNQDRSIIEGDSAEISVYLRVLGNPAGMPWRNYNARKETGHIGLSSQGVNCMNAVLQSLLSIDSFGKAIYQIRTEGQHPNKSVPRALQRLLYNMQTSDQPANATELRLSLGRDSPASSVQDDVQKFIRVLRDDLESKMRGTPGEGVISKLFAGKTKTSVTCINVNYEETVMEEFHDIELNIEGMETLYDTLRHYVATKILDGNNKHQTGRSGLQDARKSVTFQSLPPVLHLHLKRYERDSSCGVLMKANGRFEFPFEIDLGEFLDEKPRNSKPWKYRLHSVLVQSGDLDGGKFSVFINPGQRDRWFKFDGEWVTPATAQEVLEEHYGGEPPNEDSPQTQGDQIRATTKSTDARMLVYIHEMAISEVLAPVTEKDIPLHLRRHRQEKERKERDSLVTLSVITDEIFSRHQGFDLTAPDEENSPLCNLPTFHVPKQETYSQLKSKVAQYFGYPESQFRLWEIARRQNKTVRIDRRISDNDRSSTVESICNHMHAQRGAFYLYLDILPDPSLEARLDDARAVLIFLKHFDVARQSLFGVGKVRLPRGSKVGELIPIINGRMGWPPVKALRLYEEIKPGMIEPMKQKYTFTQSEIIDGDIVCFQVDTSEQEDRDLESWGLCSSAQRFYERLQN